MITLKGNRGLFIKEDGNCIEYKITSELMHQELIEDFCMQMGYSYPSEDTIVKNNHIYFRIANETVIVYMPNKINDLQLYQLELLLPEFDNLSYLGVIKYTQTKKEKYIYNNITDKIYDISEKFSNEVIPSYFNKNCKGK